MTLYSIFLGILLGKYLEFDLSLLRAILRLVWGAWVVWIVDSGAGENLPLCILCSPTFLQSFTFTSLGTWLMIVSGNSMILVCFGPCPLVLCFKAAWFLIFPSLDFDLFICSRRELKQFAREPLGLFSISIFIKCYVFLFLLWFKNFWLLTVFRCRIARTMFGRKLVLHKIFVYIFKISVNKIFR